jgi:glycosyltransferase involved in cell wall biosynthesis
MRTADPSVRLALVGDGPLAGAVDAGVRRLGLGGAVHRTGAIPHDDVAPWMAAADVLSMVSRNEPLGVVALEALASGRPVVATSVGGAREVVPADGPGRIVDPGDPAALAAALTATLSSPPDPAACRAVAEGHSLALQAARVEAVLEDAVADGAAARVPRR